MLEDESKRFQCQMEDMIEALIDSCLSLLTRVQMLRILQTIKLQQNSNWHVLQSAKLITLIAMRVFSPTVSHG